MYFIIRTINIYILDVLYLYPKVDFPFKYFGNRKRVRLVNAKSIL
jgi:hypothetical protein